MKEVCMANPGLDHLIAELKAVDPVRPMGRVRAVEGGLVRVSGLSDHAAMGDQVRLVSGNDAATGEVVALGGDLISV